DAERRRVIALRVDVTALDVDAMKVVITLIVGDAFRACYRRAGLIVGGHAIQLHRCIRNRSAVAQTLNKDGAVLRKPLREDAEVRQLDDARVAGIIRTLIEVARKSVRERAERRIQCSLNVEWNDALDVRPRMSNRLPRPICMRR